MAGGEQASHRPGLLKQQNKSHKNGRHRSKSEIDKNNKGKQIFLFYWRNFLTNLVW
jgi:pre-rRNA-processing protein TSR1